MSSDPGPTFEPFMLTADSVAATRSDVDVELAREVFAEAATLLHDGLVLDGLDEHDTQAVIVGLCEDLVSDDPGASIRARSGAVLLDSSGIHDAEAVSAAYLLAVNVLQL